MSPVLELRRYTLHEGKREELVTLFEREFIEPQEALGIDLVGQFCDLRDENAFVWLRGFREMEARARALSRFYGGRVWLAHRDAANATMVHSDNVLLLRPARPDAGFAAAERARGPAEGRCAENAPVAATILFLSDGADEADVISFFELAIAPEVVKSGAAVLGYFVTEPARNSFERLPVREDVRVFVWFAGCSDLEMLERATDSQSDTMRTAAQAPALAWPPELLLLEPTPRSRLSGSSPPSAALVDLHNVSVAAERSDRRIVSTMSHPPPR